ncbi:hypothetical protein TGPRC2_203350B [Toxoplasma gondii TgCatPRC2]|uniref:Uncharacterized protein n=1 Tax=Toxoplasma gondii TgCatPRC2 TaxID=1130821 RepID=A0A151HAV8_TOXGO|nr:hypothetical protein TGPRC2_203350B [Toxoplasma gondii TgCatPRC2]
MGKTAYRSPGVSPFDFLEAERTVAFLPQAPHFSCSFFPVVFFSSRGRVRRRLSLVATAARLPSSASIDWAHLVRQQSEVVASAALDSRPFLRGEAKVLPCAHPGPRLRGDATGTGALNPISRRNERAMEREGNPGAKEEQRGGGREEEPEKGDGEGEQEREVIEERWTGVRRAKWRARSEGRTERRRERTRKRGF